jgi:uncharacterized protein YacL
MQLSIGRIIAVGAIAALIFGLTTFAYAYTKAGDMQSFLTAMSSAAGGKTEVSTMYLAATQWYFLVAMASFTSLGNAITAMMGSLSAVASQLSALTGSSMQIPDLSNLFPSTVVFYLMGIVSGFVAAFFLAKKESKWTTALIAPVIPAVIVTALMAVITSLAASQMTASSTTTLALAGADYALIFVVTYVFIAIGTLIAAALKHVMKK